MTLFDPEPTFAPAPQGPQRVNLGIRPAHL
jgi:hypothetical protein